MKARYCVPILLLLLSCPLFAQEQPWPVMHYRSVPHFLKFPPHVYMGEANGVALDAKGDIFVFNRGDHPLMEFDPSGNFMQTIGDGLYAFMFPHAVRVDAEGNLWIVDEGSNMVVKFDPQWRVEMTLGRRSEIFDVNAPPPPPSPELFNRPTDVAFDPAGDIFVSDGYGNSRVVKYDKNGKFVKAWGKRGTAPGEFNLPHSIVADDHGHVYVADRENYRIQVFDYNGNFITQWKNIGAPWALCIAKGPKPAIFMADGYKNRILKLDMNGHVLGTYGETGRELGQFLNVHGLACGPGGVLYAGETRNWRVQKLVPEGNQ